MSGCGLVSGSKDGSCRVWDILSGQTIRLLQMKGNPFNYYPSLQCVCVLTGAVVHSLVVWGMSGALGRKMPREPVTISVSPFQKQLHYSHKQTGLEDGVQMVLHQSIDPVGLYMSVCFDS